jgi:hypothetical protein
MNELDLFAAALAFADPDQREALLKRECSGRPDLRSRIDQLLEAHFKSHPLLDQPAPNGAGGRAPVDFIPLEVAGAVIAGKYKRVGEGGMGSVWMAEDPRYGRVRFLECAVLIAVGLLAFELAWHYPSFRHASSWREKDWLTWYHAHQLFRRDPEELAESELEDVRQWCRCLVLVDRYNKTGLNGLTDDECELVVETLEKLCPNLQEHGRFRPVYEACRRRLADAPSGAWCATNTREE